MYKFLLSLVFVSILSLPVQAKDELLFVTLDSFPPFTWQEGEKAVGIDVDIIKALSKRSGIPIKIEFKPWKRVIYMIREGEADGGFAAFKTPEREIFSLFIEPAMHYSTYKVFVKKGKEFEFNSIRDLFGRTIGKNHGFKISQEFDRALEDHDILTIEGRTMEHNIKLLKAGRTDGLLGNEAEVLHVMKLLGIQDDLVALPKPLRVPRPAYLMISRASDVSKNNALMDKLRQTLSDMKADGTFDEINARYLK